MTGKGKSASWRIRGEQLGEAIGATVHPLCDDVRGFDLAVLIKRVPADLVFRLQRFGIPIVYDVVDAWPQPEGNDWTERACKTWLAERISIIRPAAIVAATQAMARDCAVFGIPVLALPHHARPDQPLNPVREVVSRVGYEGGPNYLGDWLPRLERACKSRGWTFHVKQTALVDHGLADLDIVVALRDQQGYAARQWKSGVKLANAQATGTPVVATREAGYLETASGGERWADTIDEVHAAFDDLRDYQNRAAAAAALRSAAPRLADIAATYKEWLCRLPSRS